jgi:hypothetical protein
MDINDRIQELELGQILLGKYTGLLMMLYADHIIDRSYYLEELKFILRILISLKGLDSEDVLVIGEMIRQA